MPASYRIAGRLSSRDLTGIAAESQFARCVRELFARVRPQRIIETGTYLGTGTTTIIASALRQLALADAEFISIEINPGHLAKARENLARAGLSVCLLHGLSVPRGMLPTPAQIEQQLVRSVLADGLVVDHEEQDRVRLYHRETDFAGLPDDLLGQTLRRWHGRADFILLDSGGHMGYVEFGYLIEQLRGPCFIALDDIYHVKHHLSYRQIQQDQRFRIVAASEEKFGFCIARFQPNAASAPGPLDCAQRDD